MVKKKSKKTNNKENSNQEDIEVMEFSELSESDSKMVDILYEQENYKEVLRIIPNNPEPIYLYAEQLIKKNNLKKDMPVIMDCYEKLKVLDPKWAKDIASKLEIYTSDRMPEYKLKEILSEYINKEQWEHINPLCNKHKNNAVFADIILSLFEETPLWEKDKPGAVYENRKWARIAEIWYRDKVIFSEIQKNKIKEIIKEAYNSDLRPDNYDHYIDRYFKSAGCIVGLEGDFLTAVEKGELNDVKKLISKGVDINVTNSDGENALILVIGALLCVETKSEYSKYISLIKYLLENKIDINKECNSGDTALSLSLGNNFQDVAQLLLSNGAIYDEGYIDNFALAGMNQYINDIIKNKKFDLTQIIDGYEGNLGSSALRLAAENGHVDTIKLLVSFGAVPTLDGLVPFAAAGQLKIVKELIEKKKADVNSYYNGWTSLIVSAKNGLKDIVEYLLSKKAIIDKLDEHYGRTALMWATEDEQVDTVKILLKNKADKLVKDKYGDTALSLATKRKNKELVKLLK